MNATISSVNSGQTSRDSLYHAYVQERVALSGPDQLSISPRQTEALLPTDLVPAGQGFDQQDVEETQEQSRHVDDIRQIADKANDYMQKAGTRLEFVVSEETGRVVISVIESETNKLVRKIPPDSMNRLADQMMEMRGLLFEAQG